MASLHSVGTLNLACCTGGTKGSRQIVCTPGILPVVSNDWENAFLSEMMSCTSFTVTLWFCNESFSMDLEVGSCNKLFPMGWDVPLGEWSWNALFPVSVGVTLVTWSCEALFPMGNSVVLDAWSYNVLWWSWNGVFWYWLHFRSDFFGDFVVGAFLTGMLGCNGLLNETCLLFGVLVIELTSVWVPASLGTLILLCPSGEKWGRISVWRVLKCPQKCRMDNGIIWGEVLCWTSMVKYPRNCFVVPSWGDQVLAVLLRAFCLRWASLVNALGRGFCSDLMELYWHLCQVHLYWERFTALFSDELKHGVKWSLAIRCPICV